MSAHVLLNFLKLGERGNARLAEYLISFRNEFNKLKYKRSRMLRFYLSYVIKITLKSHF